VADEPATNERLPNGRVTMDGLLGEQIAYYRARAGEYDEWFLRQGRYDRGPALNEQWFEEVGQVVGALEAFAPTGRVLELAGGTGLWTERLVHLADSVTVVDASPASITTALSTPPLREAAKMPSAPSYSSARFSSYAPSTTDSAEYIRSAATGPNGPRTSATTESSTRRIPVSSGAPRSWHCCSNRSTTPGRLSKWTRSETSRSVSTCGLT